MNLQEAKVGMRVLFGRPDGEKTTGKIVKINPKKAKVEILEDRGRTTTGKVWGVPYSMMTEVSTNGQKSVKRKTSRSVLVRIAARLTGIHGDDLTTAESQIVTILEKEGLLDKDECGNVIDL